MTTPQFLDDYYWMHLRPDGLIEKLPKKPWDRASVYVRVLADHEETTTHNRLQVDPELRCLVYHPAPPPGDGWVKKRAGRHDDPHHSIWRRPRR